jgi:sulfate transport system permease protein
MKKYDPAARSERLKDPLWVRLALTALALAFLAGFLVVPLVVIFNEALSQGFAAYVRALSDEEARNALGLTAFVVLVAVPINTVFGLCAAWAIARFQFRGRQALVTALDLPFAVSPVVSGLVFVLLLGAQSAIGPWLIEHEIRIVFAWPGLVLATMFVTVPFVARELIPLMEEQGAEEELAALSLGANGWQMFWRITLPKVRWALLYGVILLNARAVGEFGAVSVVSGHVRGQTNTAPLHVEILYNEYNFQAAFAVASVLALLAVVTIVARTLVEWRVARRSA